MPSVALFLTSLFACVSLCFPSPSCLTPTLPLLVFLSSVPSSSLLSQPRSPSLWAGPLEASSLEAGPDCLPETTSLKAVFWLLGPMSAQNPTSVAFGSLLPWGEAAGAPRLSSRGGARGGGPGPRLRPSRVPARSASSALAAEPPLSPDEWSRLLPGRDPAPPGAPASPGEVLGQGRGRIWVLPGSWLQGQGRGAPVRRVQPGAHSAGIAGTAAKILGWWWQAGEGAGQRAALGGKEEGRQGARTRGAARAGGNDPVGSARTPAAGQRGREARAFCPGFSGGASAAVSSARVFVFRW